MILRNPIIPALVTMALLASASQAQVPNPQCQRLEAQLASLDRGNDDPARAQRIRAAEDGVNRQQFEVDKLVAQSRRNNCEGSGFLSLFNPPPAQCGQMQERAAQARATLAKMQNELEQLNGGTADRAAQRRQILIALGDSGCGPQYRQAAVNAPQGGGTFIERLFGGGGSLFSPSGGDTFRTICVRTCDGYYYPISFATTQANFRNDEQVCQRMCPAAEVSLYTYRNPGEEVSQAVSLSGRLYTELPAAFRYRQQWDKSCSCRAAGQSWSEALKNNDITLQQGDVVVTEDRARRMSQPVPAKPAKTDPRAAKNAPVPSAPSAVEQNAATPAPQDADKRTVRTVGPTFYPVR